MLMASFQALLNLSVRAPGYSTWVVDEVERRVLVPDWQHAMLASLPVQALVKSRVSHRSVITTMLHFEGLWLKFCFGPLIQPVWRPV